MAHAQCAESEGDTIITRKYGTHLINRGIAHIICAVRKNEQLYVVIYWHYQCLVNRTDHFEVTYEQLRLLRKKYDCLESEIKEP